MKSDTYYYKKDKNLRLSEHFSVGQFRCKDKSDKILINGKLILILEELYSALNPDKIKIISGYRTPVYSQKHGGYSTDMHTKGKAADIILIKNGKTVSTKTVCIALENINPNLGIGIIDLKGKVHIDTRGYKCFFDETQNSRTLISFKNYYFGR